MVRVLWLCLWGVAFFSACTNYRRPASTSFSITDAQWSSRVASLRAHGCTVLQLQEGHRLVYVEPYAGHDEASLPVNGKMHVVNMQDGSEDCLLLHGFECPDTLLRAEDLEMLTYISRKQMTGEVCFSRVSITDVQELKYVPLPGIRRLRFHAVASNGYQCTALCQNVAGGWDSCRVEMDFHGNVTLTERIIPITCE